MKKVKLKTLLLFIYIIVSTVLFAFDYNISLSGIEKNYLSRNTNKIYVGYSNDEPYAFNDDGNARGFTIDVMKKIAERIGVEIEFNYYDNISTRLEKLRKNEIQILTNIIYSKEREKLFNFGELNIEARFAIYVREGDSEKNSLEKLKGKKIAVLDSYGLNSLIKKYCPNADLVYVDSPDEMLTKVSKGEADATIIGENVGNYKVLKLGLHNLMIGAYADFDELKDTKVYAYVVDKDNEVLSSILEKAYETLTKSEILNIWRKWTKPQSFPSENNLLKLSAEEIAYLEARDYLSVMSLDQFQPFNFVRDGEVTGYSVDYMRLIANLLNKDLKFIQKPWSNQLDMLKKGDLDIIPHIAKNSVRDKFVDYTDFMHLTYLTGFIVQQSSEIDKMEDLAKRKLAVVNKTYIHDYLVANFPNTDLLLLESTEKVTEAVAQGKAYAGVGSLPTFNYFIQEKWLGNLKIADVSNFGLALETKMPMGVKKGNRVLKSILEKAHAAVPEEEINKLKHKWLNMELNTYNPNKLSVREETFVKNNSIIRFRIRNNRPPFEFEKDGKPAGLTVDYLTVIAKKIGLNIEFILDDSSSKEALKIMNKRDKFDTLAYLVKSEEREKRFAFGDSYLSYPMMIISHKKSSYIGKTADLRGRKVAVEKGFLTKEWLNRDYSGINIVDAKDTKEALQMVNDGEVDAYVGNLAIANYMMTHGGMNNLKVQAPSGYGDINYHFVAPKEWPELVSLLNKGHNMLTANDHTLIQQRWFSLQVMETFNYRLLIQIIVLSFIFIVTILYWNRQLSLEKSKTKKALKELKEVSVRDKLTSLFNRIKLDEVLEDEFERAKKLDKTFALIIIDIDFFKRVNDTYGHNVGDKVLIEFSNLLKENFRDVDTIGRWGGEEFLIICPETNKDEIIVVAEKIRQIIEKNQFEQVGRVTASLGCSVYGQDEFIDDVIVRADNALYLSKNSGRNQVNYE